jgi:hypothetical protein
MGKNKQYFTHEETRRNILTCVCLRRRLFRVTLEISRTMINLAYRDIVTSQRGYWPLLIRTRYVCTCVGAGSGMGGGIRKIKAIRLGAYYYSLVLYAQPCKYDMYKSSVRHIHDTVLSSLKMKGIRFFFQEYCLSIVAARKSGHINSLKTSGYSTVCFLYGVPNFRILLRVKNDNGAYINTAFWFRKTSPITSRILAHLMHNTLYIRLGLKVKIF